MITPNPLMNIIPAKIRYANSFKLLTVVSTTGREYKIQGYIVCSTNNVVYQSQCKPCPKVLEKLQLPSD